MKFRILLALAIGALSAACVTGSTDDTDTSSATDTATGTGAGGSASTGTGTGTGTSTGGGGDDTTSTNGSSGTDTVVDGGGTSTDSSGTSTGTEGGTSTGSDTGTGTDAATDEFMCDGETFSACGGDIVGKWSFDADCVDVSGALATLRESCATADLVKEFSLVNGYFNFESAGTYSLEISYTETTTATYPQECRNNDNPCPSTSFNASLKEETADACGYESKVVGYQEDGTYNTAGSVLNSTNSKKTEPDAPADYCVNGDTLMLFWGGSSPTIYVMHRVTE